MIQLVQLITISFPFQPTSAHTPVTPSPFKFTPGMSQAILPDIVPANGLNRGFGGLNCPSCGIFTPYVPVNSDKNGNKGVPFAVVCPC